MPNRKTDFSPDELCPVRHLLEVFGGKWKLPIVCVLSDGMPHRYGVMKRNLAGITNVMLSQSLKELEAHGVIHRKQYDEVPPKVEYTLTTEGEKILPTLYSSAQWGANHMYENNLGTPHCEKCRADVKRGMLCEGKHSKD